MSEADQDTGGVVEELEDLFEPIAPRPVFHLEYSRDLTPADLGAPRTTAPPRALVRIHASHHALARALAAGMRQTEASLITGYTQARISQLTRDQAFQALVTEYRQEVRSTFANLAERMHNLSLDAMELLHERLLDEPEKIGVPMLLDVVKAFADRTGHGPGQEVSLKLTSDTIDRPPRETFDEWQKRRERELSGDESGTAVGTPAGATNGGSTRRLVS